MSVESIESLISRIMDQYNRKPEAWSFLINHKGNTLALTQRKVVQRYWLMLRGRLCSISYPLYPLEEELLL